MTVGLSFYFLFFEVDNLKFRLRKSKVMSFLHLKDIKKIRFRSKINLKIP
jgi:hypothetical protein